MLGANARCRQHRLDQVPGIVGQQITANADPQPLQRSARDTARVMMVGAIVDQERLERLEEQAGAKADAGRAFALLARNAA